MKIKTPYTFNFLIPIIAWSILCWTFSYFLIIILVDFENEIAEKSFLYISPMFVLFFSFLSILKHGGIKFLNEKNIDLINKNFSSKGLNSSVSTEEVKKILNSLVAVCERISIDFFVTGILILLLIILTSLINLASLLNVLFIFIGGTIAIFFSSFFAKFFCQKSMFFAIKECRKILTERGESFNDINLPPIKSKLYFLFILPLFIALIVLIFVSSFDVVAAIMILIAILMIFIIDGVLLSCLSGSLREINNFTKDFPLGGRTFFITGSLDKEIVNLFDALNRASEQAYLSKKELEKSKEEMTKRVDELEKFFKLTINRELKMLELKKELKNK
jgi:hypothetical protein